MLSTHQEPGGLREVRDLGILAPKRHSLRSSDEKPPYSQWLRRQIRLQMREGGGAFLPCLAYFCIRAYQGKKQFSSVINVPATSFDDLIHVHDTFWVICAAILVSLVVLLAPVLIAMRMSRSVFVHQFLVLLPYCVPQQAHFDLLRLVQGKNSGRVGWKVGEKMRLGDQSVARATQLAGHSNPLPDLGQWRHHHLLHNQSPTKPAVLPPLSCRIISKERGKSKKQAKTVQFLSHPQEKGL